MNRPMTAKQVEHTINLLLTQTTDLYYEQGNLVFVHPQVEGFPIEKLEEALQKKKREDYDKLKNRLIPSAESKFPSQAKLREYMDTMLEYFKGHLNQLFQWPEIRNYHLLAIWGMMSRGITCYLKNVPIRDPDSGFPEYAVIDNEAGSASEKVVPILKNSFPHPLRPQWEPDGEEKVKLCMKWVLFLCILTIFEESYPGGFTPSTTSTTDNM